MHDYHKHRREREPLVKELFTLGFSASEIAGMIPWSTATIRSDIRRLRGTEAFPERPKKRHKMFVPIIRRYAELAVTDTRNDVEWTVKRILKSHHYIRDLRVYIEGMVAYSVVISNCGSKFPEGYRKLCATIFGVPKLFGLTYANFDDVGLADELFKVFLEEVYAGKIPKNHEDAQWRCAHLVNEHSEKEDIIVSCDVEKMILLIDKTLSDLNPREAEVLAMRFGIGHNPMTLEQVAMSLAQTREYIRQIEAKAIRKLRHPSVAKPIFACIETIGSLQRKCANLQEDKDALENECRRLRNILSHAGINAKLEPPAYSSFLDTQIDQLELSVRSANCLIYFANMKFVGEVVQKTEAELLRIKNFGRKSLKEIKEILGRMGLTLGMKIPDWRPPNS